MNKRILFPLLFLSLLVFGVGFFNNSFSVSLQTPPQNPPLTPAQIQEVRNYIPQFDSHWDNGEDIYDEFDADEMPKTVQDHFKNRLKSLGDLLNGCWALPNSNRPISTDNLKNWGNRLEAAADRDDAADRTSSNPSDWDLEAELNSVENEAKALIAKWCNLGQPANAREFCPCVFNCAGTDNTGKTWSSTAYTCNNNCIAPQQCNTATCTCYTPTPESKPSDGNPESQPVPGGGTTESLI